MAKRWSITYLVALALLGCLVGTQDLKGFPPLTSKGSSSPQVPQSYPRLPQVKIPPISQPQLPPKTLPYPQFPPVQPQVPQVGPQYPQIPKFPPSHPQLPPKTPQYPQFPPVQPQVPQVVPQYPQIPKFPPSHPQLPPKTPQYPQFPPVQPQVPQVVPQYPQFPPVQPQKPQVGPQYPQFPPVQPKVPQVVPQYPQFPPVQPQKPQVVPQYPQFPPVQPKVPQVVPQYPKFPPVQPQKPQVVPQYPQIPPVKRPPPIAQIKPQYPAVTQTPSIYKPSATKQTPVHSCNVAQNVQVPCGGAGISAAGCNALNCCFGGQNCYFGKAVTVQCTKDAQFIVVVSRDATLPNIDLESISLLGQGHGCTNVDSNSEFAIYQFPVTACGSIVMEEPGVIIYENRMSSSYEVGVGPLGAITRDSYYELLFQCRYIGTSVETVVVEVLPLQDPPLPVAALGPITVNLRLANGQCNTKGCNEVDAAYSSFYNDGDYPVTKVLRDPVYVEVQLLEKTDPNLVLTLGHCWTTTSPNAHALPQWDILIGGCPYRDDRYLSSLVPIGPSSGLNFPSHYRRFIFKMFTFVDHNSMEPLTQLVYIHCSTAVCTAAPGRSCEPSCSRKKRDVEAVDQTTAEPNVVVSVGPVIISTSA